MRHWLAGLACALLLAGCGEEHEGQEVAVKLFLNGTVYTGVDEAPTAEAVIVEGDRIAFVGPAAEARSRVKDADIIDLKGAFLYPGFTDAHMHLRSVGQRELTLNLEGSPSLAAMVARIAEEVESRGAGEIIIGRGWIETHWPEGRFPTRTDLDAVAPDHPVFLGRADGHAAVVNSLMLELAGITRETESPRGGAILRDEAGEPTGLLVDNAMALVEPVLEAIRPTLAEVERFYEAGGRVYAQFGWTGAHNMSVAPSDVPVIERMADEGRLKLRVYNSLDGLEPETLALFEEGPRASENGLVVTRAIKLYMDGALGSRGALLFEPYRDAETSGLLIAEKDTYLDLMTRALQAGIQVNTHAIGDKANRMVLDWYEEVFDAVPMEQRAITNPRFRVEHAQHVSRQDWPRFAELGVIPSMQPSHAIGDLYFASARLGPERLGEAYPWKPLVEAGAIIPGGSDAPVEKGDPRIEFYAAVARRSLDGFSDEGWHPEYAVNRQQALKMFTLWPAFASFREDELGTVEPGKLADFTVFGRDIMTIPAREILETPVVMTVAGGEIVYRNPDF